MPFWRKESEADKEARLRQEAAVKALQSGDIPPIARERIIREKNYGKKFFSSDLSTREYLLTKEAGFETIGQVMGTAFFKIGFWGYFNRWQSGTGELTQVTRAISDSRSTAVERMKLEAKLLGASGVIGVRLTRKDHAWASNLTEFTAFGTAIRLPGWPQDAEPFTSSLNGQEFWQLYRSGYLPKSLIMGVCAYYMHMDPETRRTLYSWFAPNREVANFTSGYNMAARLANKRLYAEITRVGADGAVGVKIDPGIETIEYEINDTSYHDILLNYVILGTAVSSDPRKEQRHAPPLLCLNLAKGTWGNLSSSSHKDPGSFFEAAGKDLVDQGDFED